MVEREETGRTKILIVDDHPIVRQGLSQMLSQEHDFEVCGDVGTFEEALGAIEALHPDLAAVIEVWPELPQAARDAIVTLVDAMSGGGSPRKWLWVPGDARADRASRTGGGSRRPHTD